MTEALAVVTFYLDASALVKRYMAETGTAWVESVCADDFTSLNRCGKF